MITYTDEFGTTWELAISLDRYRNNDNLYVGLVVAEDVYDADDEDPIAYAGEPYADLSININHLPPEYIAVDCSYGEFDKFIEDNLLGTFTGEYMTSGYSTYPVYKMDLNELQRHTI